MTPAKCKAFAWTVKEGLFSSTMPDCCQYPVSVPLSMQQEFLHADHLSYLVFPSLGSLLLPVLLFLLLLLLFLVCFLLILLLFLLLLLLSLLVIFHVEPFLDRVYQVVHMINFLFRHRHLLHQHLRHLHFLRHLLLHHFLRHLLLAFTLMYLLRRAT